MTEPFQFTQEPAQKIAEEPSGPEKTWYNTSLEKKLKYLTLEMCKNPQKEYKPDFSMKPLAKRKSPNFFSQFERSSTVEKLRALARGKRGESFIEKNIKSPSGGDFSHRKDLDTESGHDLDDYERSKSNKSQKSDSGCLLNKTLHLQLNKAIVKHWGGYKQQSLERNAAYREQKTIRAQGTRKMMINDKIANLISKFEKEEDGRKNHDLKVALGLELMLKKTLKRVWVITLFLFKILGKCRQLHCSALKRKDKTRSILEQICMLQRFFKRKFANATKNNRMHSAQKLVH